MWKALLGGVAASLLISAQAVAADMPRKAPVAPVVAAANWTGFYIGGTVGAMFGSDQIVNTSIVPNFVGTRDDLRGPIGGGTVGVNWQIGPLVIGAEADASATNARVVYSPLVCSPVCIEKWQWLATVRGRAGLAFNNLLFYVTAGGAWSHFDAVIGLLPNGASDVRGWAAGGGVEAALTPNWSVKLEYLHVDVGQPTYFNRTPDLIRLDPRINIVRLGVNYRFGWGGDAVVAKY